MNNPLKIGAAVVVLALAGLGVWAMTSSTPTAVSTIAPAPAAHPAPVPRDPATPSKTAPSQAMMTAPPVAGDEPGTATDTQALIAELEALQLDRDAAEEDEARAFRAFIGAKSRLYRQVESELESGVESDQPEALLGMARAKVALGDAFTETVVPEGLTEVQTKAYVAASEKKARGYYDDALALLDRAEAADAGIADRALELRTAIQAR